MRFVLHAFEPLFPQFLRDSIDSHSFLWINHLIKLITRNTRIKNKIKIFRSKLWEHHYRFVPRPLPLMDREGMSRWCLSSNPEKPHTSHCTISVSELSTYVLHPNEWAWGIRNSEKTDRVSEQNRQLIRKKSWHYEWKPQRMDHIRRCKILSENRSA